MHFATSFRIQYRVEFFLCHRHKQILFWPLFWRSDMPRSSRMIWLDYSLKTASLCVFMRLSFRFPVTWISLKLNISVEHLYVFAHHWCRPKRLSFSWWFKNSWGSILIISCHSEEERQIVLKPLLRCTCQVNNMFLGWNCFVSYSLPYFGVCMCKKAK